MDDSALPHSGHVRARRDLAAPACARLAGLLPRRAFGLREFRHAAAWRHPQARRHRLCRRGEAVGQGDADRPVRLLLGAGLCAGVWRPVHPCPCLWRPRRDGRGCIAICGGRSVRPRLCAVGRPDVDHPQSLSAQGADTHGARGLEPRRFRIPGRALRPDQRHGDDAEAGRLRLTDAEDDVQHHAIRHGLGLWRLGQRLAPLRQGHRQPCRRRRHQRLGDIPNGRRRAGHRRELLSDGAFGRRGGPYADQLGSRRFERRLDLGSARQPQQRDGMVRRRNALLRVLQQDRLRVPPLHLQGDQRRHRRRFRRIDAEQGRR